MLRFVFALLVVLPTASHASPCEDLSQTFRAAFPDAQSLHKPMSAKLRQGFLDGYASTRAKSPAAVNRMQEALETRFADGCLIQMIVPDPATEIVALISDQGDMVARAFAAIATWTRSPREFQEMDNDFQQIVELMSDTTIDLGTDSFVAKVWSSQDFEKVKTAEDAALYSWGVSPDFVEITYSSLGKEGCEFLPVKGWLARQTCP